MPNIAALTAKHNSKILKAANPPVQDNVRCNCNDLTTCPLPGKCQIQNVVYQAITSTTSGETKSYVGVASNFKARYYNHTSSFRHSDKRKKTKLSEYIWTHKDKNCGEMPQLKWNIIGKAPRYSPVTNVCQLCLAEKYVILFKPELAQLNSRNELFSSCRHKNSILLIPKENPLDGG